MLQLCLEVVAAGKAITLNTRDCSVDRHHPTCQVLSHVTWWDIWTLIRAAVRPDWKDQYRTKRQRLFLCAYMRSIPAEVLFVNPLQHLIPHCKQLSLQIS
jgi:hypothetical protein